MSTDMAPVYQASEANTCLYTMPFLALEMGHLLSFNMMPHLEKKENLVSVCGHVSAGAHGGQQSHWGWGYRQL